MVMEWAVGINRPPMIVHRGCLVFWAGDDSIITAIGRDSGALCIYNILFRHVQQDRMVTSGRPFGVLQFLRGGHSG